MSKKLELVERLETATELVRRARIHLDIWWFLEGVETRQEIEPALQTYHEFFRFDRHAHFVAAVVYLSSLLKDRKDTINIQSLVRETKKKTGHTIEIDQLLSALDHTAKKVHILRNQVFAHRSATDSYQKTFEAASVTANELRLVTENARRVCNKLRRALGLPAVLFNEFPKSDLEDLFAKLRR